MIALCSVVLSLSLLLSGCDAISMNFAPVPTQEASYLLSDVPDYSGEPYVVLNNGLPNFPDDDKTSVSFERYSELDYLDRPGVAYANVGLETMPTEDREGIGQVKPAGWQTARYDFIEGKYLYNRCHLIGFQLTGENANAKNLITGTRYLNITGMLPFENMVADYVKETSNHVLYRVTPVYRDLDLLASGLEMEAWSVEDQGEGICFDVYVYNVQPGVEIDYVTGNSQASSSSSSAAAETSPSPAPTPTPATDSNTENSSWPRLPEDEITYVINEKSKKFHYPSCGSAVDMSEENRHDTNLSRNELVKKGYSPCGTCKP